MKANFVCFQISKRITKQLEECRVVPNDADPRRFDRLTGRSGAIGLVASLLWVGISG